MDWCLWLYRQAYWCRRRFCPRDVPVKEIFVDKSSLPWFWIGLKYDDDKSISVTEVINSSIYPGTRVTCETLSQITGFKDGVWRYVDSQTLEELDFPSDGFIIKDVSDKPVSDFE
jgi:hypothetical protein